MPAAIDQLIRLRVCTLKWPYVVAVATTTARNRVVEGAGDEDRARDILLDRAMPASPRDAILFTDQACRAQSGQAGQD